MITDGRVDELSLGHAEFVGLWDTQRQLGIQGCRGGTEIKKDREVGEKPER